MMRYKMTRKKTHTNTSMRKARNMRDPHFFLYRTIMGSLVFFFLCSLYNSFQKFTLNYSDTTCCDTTLLIEEVASKSCIDIKLLPETATGPRLQRIKSNPEMDVFSTG